MATVLLVDDQRGVRRALASRLEAAGFEVLQASDGVEAWDEFEQREPQLVITDMAMPRSDGIDLTGRIRECSDVPIIMFSAYASVPTAVAAVKAGADEFLPSRDLDVQELVRLARRLCDDSHTRREAPGFAERLPGASTAIVRARTRLSALAPLRTSVLLLGEPGSGRTTAARALHDLGLTTGLDLYKLDAARFQPSSSVPARGMVFLRGIEQLSPGGQAFWARRLAGMCEGDPLRIVASSGLPLEEWRQGPALASELVLPLLRFPVELPPLRERPEDIPALVAAMLGRISARLGKVRPRLAADALRKLQDGSWPGNAAQLKQLLERAIAFSPSHELSAAFIEELLDLSDDGLAAVRREHTGCERDRLQSALRESGGNISRTAARLGISRQSVYRLMEKLQIPIAPRRSKDSGLGGVGPPSR